MIEMSLKILSQNIWHLINKVFTKHKSYVNMVNLTHKDCTVSNAFIILAALPKFYVLFYLYLTLLLLCHLSTSFS